jgi:integrase
VSEEVVTYLSVCKARGGKSGYGLAPRTYEAYEYRLGFLTEFEPNAYMDQVTEEFIERFRSFLLEHEKDLADRTSYNIMQAVSTFLIKKGNHVAKPFLKEMKFPPTEVVPYSNDELQKFFAVCDDEEELLFKFFLHSMARDMEVAHCEVRDLKFDKNILHICPKPDKGFRLKGKRSGQAMKGRKVPIPTMFMARMKKYCAGKRSRDLLFPNGKGGVEYHFLRRCDKIAKRAGLNWEDFDLHRWRKTGATRHHEKGVSVRKIQAWLGHESLEVTLDYLGVDDAADEISQEQVNIRSVSPMGSPGPVSFTEISMWSSVANCDLTVSTPPLSCIASMPLSMRFMSTCCTCTRSTVTFGSSAARSVRIETPRSLASLRSGRPFRRRPH